MFWQLSFKETSWYSTGIQKILLQIFLYKLSYTNQIEYDSKSYIFLLTSLQSEKFGVASNAAWYREYGMTGSGSASKKSRRASATEWTLPGNTWFSTPSSRHVLKIIFYCRSLTDIFLNQPMYTYEPKFCHPLAGRKGRSGLKTPQKINQCSLSEDQ